MYFLSPNMFSNIERQDSLKTTVRLHAMQLVPNNKGGRKEDPRAGMAAHEAGEEVEWIVVERWIRET